jgi:MarR family transcriptional regulator, lower aerobic nicotinate degradation pathway regulator
MPPSPGMKKSVKTLREPWALGERPGFLIRRLHQIHVALFNEACGKFDITPVQYSLLSALAQRGVADQTTLAADISLDRTTTTGALKRLAARQLIERAIDQGDRRARACRVTAVGLRLLATMEDAARSAHRETVAILDKGEQQLFLGFMQRIVASKADGTGSVDCAISAPPLPLAGAGWGEGEPRPPPEGKPSSAKRRD